MHNVLADINKEKVACLAVLPPAGLVFIDIHSDFQKHISRIRYSLIGFDFYRHLFAAFGCDKVYVFREVVAIHRYILNRVAKSLKPPGNKPLALVSDSLGLHKVCVSHVFTSIF